MYRLTSECLSASKLLTTDQSAFASTLRAFFAPTAIRLPCGIALHIASDYSQTQWNAADFAPACWQGAVSLAADNSQKTDYRRVAYTAERVTKIITPAYYVVEGDTVCYEFNTGFHGYVRVTLRDANMGERLNINGLGYQCSGEMDEQAYRKFTRRTFRNVWITGDQHFKNSQIQRVEGIETAPYPHISWH